MQTKIFILVGLAAGCIAALVGCNWLMATYAAPLGLLDVAADLKGIAAPQFWFSVAVGTAGFFAAIWDNRRGALWASGVAAAAGALKALGNESITQTAIRETNTTSFAATVLVRAETLYLLAIALLAAAIPIAVLIFRKPEKPAA